MSKAIIVETLSRRYVQESGSLGRKSTAQQFRNSSNAMRMARRLNREHPIRCYAVTWL